MHNETITNAHADEYRLTVFSHLQKHMFPLYCLNLQISTFQLLLKFTFSW